MALVDEDFGDGVVEEDVQVERAFVDAVDLGLSPTRTVSGRLLRIGAQEDGGALIVDEGLLEMELSGCGFEGQADLLRGGGQALDRSSGAGRGSQGGNSGAGAITSAPFAMERRRGSDIMPDQPAAAYSAWGRVSVIQPQRMRLPWASSWDLGA